MAYVVDGMSCRYLLQIDLVARLENLRAIHGGDQRNLWMLSRKPPMLVRVALANKMARIVWALMARGGVYQSPAVAA